MGSGMICWDVPYICINLNIKGAGMISKDLGHGSCRWEVGRWEVGDDGR